MQGDTDAGDVTEWHPAWIIRAPEQRPTDYEFGLLILNQPIKHVGLFRRLWNRACIRVAVDGGANRVLDLVRQHWDTKTYETARKGGPQGTGDQADDDDNAGYHYGGSNFFANNAPLDTIIGDLDSLSDEARRFFSSPAAARPADIVHVADQDSTDFTKAVRHVRAVFSSSPPSSKKGPGMARSGGAASSERGEVEGQEDMQGPPQQQQPRDMVCMGGLGGRVDQGLSQLHHLYMFQAPPDHYGEGRLFLLSGESLTFLLKAGRHRIYVRGGGRGKRGKHSAAVEGDAEVQEGDGKRSDSGSSKRRKLDAPPPHGDSSSSAAPGETAEKRERLPEEHEKTAKTTKRDKDDDDDRVFAKHVGIIPIREPAVISTRGLEWDVVDWPTAFGSQMSTSNHVVEDVVEVQTSGDVLFTIALRLP